MRGENEVEEAELAHVLRLYEGPSQPRPHTQRAPRMRPLAVVALILAAVALAAVVALATEGTKARTHDALSSGACADTLAFGGTHYVARAVQARVIARGRVLGHGVLRPCGALARRSTVTTVAGIDTRRAIGVEGRRTVIYVAPACARASSAQLLACLRTPR